MKSKLLYISFIVFTLFYYSVVSAQGSFKLPNRLDKQTINFKLLSNLIILPIEVNGKELNFILDSGVNQSILFNLKTKDSIDLKNVKSIKLRGLGSEEPVDAIVSTGNVFKLKNILGNSQKLYVIFNNNFDLSSKVGITIHGIIGYKLLKNFVVKINYNSKKITFYKSGVYNYSNCKKCEIFDLEFYQNKPFIKAEVKLTNAKITPVKLLIDLGGSDAMWLFENSHPDILSPTKYFDDFLGEGLSGAIYGKRAKIKALIFGKFEIKNPTVSYPDSISIAFAKKFKERNGSMGGSILKRFIVTFDYKNSKISLKKGAHFKEAFRYNMSGIDLVYNGKILVKERDNSSFSYENKQKGGNKVVIDYNYKYKFKPSYRIFKILEGSPAYDAGLLKDDILIKVNGKYVHTMDFEEVLSNFYYKRKKKVSVTVERNGQHHVFQFYLKNILE
ncbi:aspartyl protease family protein [Lutibacter sp. TH_r2]|uniref:aspartyl protease family protein n=1 Tax=Lutibacter sp. TH_r2 TaxID=3082083 RepID=UPI002955D040|nr:aspartyl protease family protein [Lutibacter sp. TH_r2]MDV7187376.1 aspartyl protease family protein [Lutibacter sp. TH_r2]